jgi:TRAP-type C4-dicarboxylate transport system permease small subunit
MTYIIVFALWALIAFAGWRVFTRAGFNGSMGILFLIPIANFIALLYLAHKDWPIGNIKN